MKDYINQVQDKKIEAMEYKIDGFLCKKMATWIGGIIITLVGLLFGYSLSAIENLENKVDRNNAQFMRIESQLSQIQTDIIWVKRELNGM